MLAWSFCTCCFTCASVFASTSSSLLFAVVADFVFPAEGTAGCRLEIFEAVFVGLGRSVPTTEIVPVTSPMLSFVQTLVGFGLAAPDASLDAGLCGCAQTEHA